MAETQERTQVFQQVRDLIASDDGTLANLDELVEKILVLVHRCYRAQGMDFVIDVHTSPFDDPVITQLVSHVYRAMLREFNMQELGKQELVTLDFAADPLNELTLGFSKATKQLIESMWKTFQDKVLRMEAKAQKE
jgi:hypothetical protein